MIAIAILAMVMAALAPGFYSALLGATVAGQRNTATGLAVQAVETVRAETYSDVAVGCPTPSTATVGRVDYSVKECIGWAPVEVGCPYPYKQVQVTVAWPAAKPVGSVDEVSDVYPGNQGPCSSSTTTTTTPVCSGAPSPPTGLASSAPAAPADESEIDLTWHAPSSTPAPIAYYQVWYSTSPGGFSSQSTYTVAGDSTTAPGSPPFEVTGLSAGTNYYFEVWSVSSCGTTSSTPGGVIEAATASAPPPPGCTVKDLSVNPTSGVVNSAGHLTNATGFSLTATVAGPCSGVTVTYTADNASQSVGLTGSGSSLTGTAGTSSTKWSPGSDAFRVYVDGQATEVVYDMTICQSGGSASGC